jgi:hypothetical protein
MSDNTIKPLDLSKTSSGRIDLKPVAPASPSATQGIRLGVGAANRTTSRIDLSAIPGAQAAIKPIGVTPAAPADSEDIYKRRTSLLDTSKIPLSATQAPAAASGGAQPRTIRVARPTIRVGSSASGATFSPGRSEPAPDAAAEAAPAKPSIRLKRPSGASVSVTPSSSSPSSIAPSEFVIQKTDDDTPGAIWAVCALLGFLAAAALVAYQILTLKGAAY